LAKNVEKKLNCCEWPFRVWKVKGRCIYDPRQQKDGRIHAGTRLDDIYSLLVYDVFATCIGLMTSRQKKWRGGVSDGMLYGRLWLLSANLLTSQPRSLLVVLKW